MKSHKVSLGKKLFQYKNASAEELNEWLELVGLSHLSRCDVSKILTLEPTTRNRFIAHTKHYGSDVVTLELFLKCPVTSNANKVREHYSLPVSKRTVSVYDPQYIASRDNVSIAEAIEYVKQYKANKATNLSNFIKKYGEQEGKRRYDDWFCKSLKKGHDSDNVKSHYTTQYWIEKGYGIEEAIELVKKTQRENSSLYVDYYILRGKTLEEARSAIRKIHDKKLGICSLTASILKSDPNITDEELKKIRSEKKDSSSYKKLGEERFIQKYNKTRKTFEELGIWTPLSDMSDWEVYKKEVWLYTNRNDLKSLPNYEKRGRTDIEGAYQLDHKFSISRGYIEGIHPSIIGSLANLHFIPAIENRQKWISCSITKEELYENQKDQP